MCVSNCGLKWEMGWQSGVPISRARSHAPQASRANKTDQSAAAAPGGGGGHHNEPHDGVHSTQSRGEEESQAWKRPIVGPSVCKQIPMYWLRWVIHLEKNIPTPGLTQALATTLSFESSPLHLLLPLILSYCQHRRLGQCDSGLTPLCLLASSLCPRCFPDPRIR